jgi:phospholipid N-methyltransferase
VESQLVKGKAALRKHSNARLESAVSRQKVQIMIFREVPVDGDGVVVDPNGQPAGDPVPSTPKLPAAASPKLNSMVRSDIAGRLRRQADTLTKTISAKLHSGTSKQSYTPRRARIAASMAQDGFRLKDQQDMLYALAAAHEDPAKVPILDKMHLLGNIRKRTEVEQFLRTVDHKLDEALVRSVRNHAEFYATLLTGPGSGPVSQTRQALANMVEGDKMAQAIVKLFRQAKEVVYRWQMNRAPVNSAVADAAAEVAKREAENKLRGNKIPGFFPTPPDLIDKLLRDAQIQPGEEVLEPEAGKGDIVDAIRARHPQAKLSLCEINGTLREFLADKGYDNVMRDFLTDVKPVPQYDCVVMNPPFESGQDIEHVLHAYAVLKPGGRLVAIMGEGAFSNSFARNKTFFEFLGFSADELRNRPALYADMPGENGRPSYVSVERNSVGSFKDSFNSTGVATRTLYLKKPVELPAAAPAAATSDAARQRARGLVLIMKMRARTLELGAGNAPLAGLPNHSRRLQLRAELLSLKSSLNAVQAR